MAQSNKKQVEALSEISDIIVQISEEDLERLESLAEQITRFNRDLGNRILDTCSILTELNDEVESVLDHMELDREDEDVGEDEDVEVAEMDEEDKEDEDEEKGRKRSKRKK